MKIKNPYTEEEKTQPPGKNSSSMGQRKVVNNLENIILLCFESVAVGFKMGLNIFWNALTSQPLVFAFFVFLLLRKLKNTFF